MKGKEKMTKEELNWLVANLKDQNAKGDLKDYEYADKMEKLMAAFKRGDDDSARNIVYSREDMLQSTSIAAPVPNQKKGNGGLVFLFIFIFAVFIVFAFGVTSSSQNTVFSSSSSSRSSSDTKLVGSLRTNPNETDSLIIAIAEQFVKSALKSPSSAKFPWDYNEYKISKSNGNWVVSGYVDASNSFGAVIRSRFDVCFTLEWINGKDHSTEVYTLIY